MPNWRMSDIHLIRCARALALANAGNSMAARIAIMAMTTNSSINVKPENLRLRTDKQSWLERESFWFKRRTFMVNALITG